MAAIRSVSEGKILYIYYAGGQYDRQLACNIHHNNCQTGGCTKEQLLMVKKMSSITLLW